MSSDVMAAQSAPAGPPLSESELQYWKSLPAQQQPAWEDAEQLSRVTAELSDRPGLVTPAELAELRGLLAEVATGRLQVVQSGDCAEDPAECEPGYVTRKVGLLDAMAGVVSMNTRRPVLRIGRMAGQFGKPRSKPTETVAGVELPVYRGNMVNSPEPDPELRRPDPTRLLAGYDAAARAFDALRERADAGLAAAGAPVWTSHEALLLDYEVPMLRRTDDGRPYLASTHLPWIGDRTRQLDGAHVALLASVANPVASKVGPSMSIEDLLTLCRTLDPRARGGPAGADRPDGRRQRGREAARDGGRGQGRGAPGGLADRPDARQHGQRAGRAEDPSGGDRGPRGARLPGRAAERRRGPGWSAPGDHAGRRDRVRPGRAPARPDRREVHQLLRPPAQPGAGT
ncbi:hypothetical protein GCM10020229_49860 [Kitasatospora albolonga]